MWLESAILFEQPHEIFARVFRELKPRTNLPEIRIEFRPFANANSSIRLDQAVLSVRISDLLERAPASILEALAYILLSKLYRMPVPRMYAERYRRYLNRKEMRRGLQIVRQTRGRKFVSGPQGTHYNLEEIFEKLNLEHFFGLMARPALGWSQRVSKGTLGHYDPSHNAIILNKLLDREKMPRLAVEYVMFHEMLHLRHPVEHRGLRRCVHTPEFKEAEKQFPRFQEAKELLKKL
ncbi:MAG: SprT-like domain-containing protein [Bryobacteraceae bacterium]